MPQFTWLVTGCSSGIGEQFVHAIIARGDRVIATARNATERLQHAKDAGAAILDLDITAPRAELDAKIKEAIGIYGTLDVLVNNAGYIEASLVEEARYSACEDTRNLFMVYTLTLVTPSAMTDSSLNSIPTSSVPWQSHNLFCRISGRRKRVSSRS